MRCRTVMVVEDDPSIREVVKLILESEGFNVVTACNGREAFSVLERIGEPCLILLDLMMPEMSGWEFLEKRKTRTAVKQLPVVVVSAVADQTELPSEVQVMRKPPDIDALLGVVRQHCEPALAEGQAA